MAEERDVPELQALVTEIDGIIQNLDGPAGQTADAMSTIKNTLLPLMKDLAESVMIGFEDIQDMVNPIKLSGADAQEIGTLLAALVQANPGNKELEERVGAALEALEQDDGEDEEEEGDEAN